MEDLSNERLTQEFNRLGVLKEQCEVSMYEIRQEWARRKTQEIDRLQDELDELNA